MAYDLIAIGTQICDRLEKSPNLRIKELAASFGMDRHTIAKAVRTVRGTSYQELRSAILLNRAHQLFTDDPFLTFKDVAARLGCPSAQALSKALRRSAGVFGCTMR